MRITRENYEQYFLDFMEGRLDPSMEKELQVFLDAHPGLRTELEDFRIHFLSTSREKYPGKEKLRKSVVSVGEIHESNADEYLFNYLEDTLDDKERADLERFLQLNPAFSYDLETWRKTRLQPDKEITYPDRQNLKRKIYPMGRIPLRIMIPAAAIILLLFTIGGIFLFPGKQLPVSPVEEITQSTGQAAQPVQTMPPILPEYRSSSTALLHERESQPVTTSFRTGQIAFQGEEASSFYSPRPITTLATISYSPGQSGLSRESRATLPGSALYREESRTRLIGRILANLVNRGKEVLVNETGQAEENNEPPAKGIVRLASATIKGYNTLTDNNVALEIQRDKKGNVLGYALTNNDEVVLSRDKNSQ